MITIKSNHELKIMQEGANILSAVLRELVEFADIGVSTKKIDILAEKLVREKGCKPNFKGYGGFPATVCTSVNNVVVHGVPGSYKLKDGDLLSLDMGLIYKGWHTDMARTIPIGRVSEEAIRLLKVTKKALKAGISNAKPGNTVGDIGNSVQRYVESHDFSVVRTLCGHGIGKDLHEDPMIPNFGKRGKGEELKEGMVVCIEPMVNYGGYEIVKSQDGFGFETKDHSLSAHFEHMIAITKNGPKILTSY